MANITLAIANVLSATMACISLFTGGIACLVGGILGGCISLIKRLPWLIIASILLITTSMPKNHAPTDPSVKDFDTTTIDQWANAPGITSEEHTERQEVKKCIVAAIVSKNPIIDLSKRIHLTSLPEELKIKGDLDLSGCTGLVNLPAKLQVKGNLNLRNCINLQCLPEDLSLKKALTCVVVKN